MIRLLGGVSGCDYNLFTMPDTVYDWHCMLGNVAVTLSQAETTMPSFHLAMPFICNTLHMQYTPIHVFTIFL